MDDQLYIWTIYRRGDNFVAKKWRVQASGPEVTTDELAANDIELLREIFRDKYGLYPLGRQEDDEIDIVESWI